MKKTILILAAMSLLLLASLSLSVSADPPVWNGSACQPSSLISVEGVYYYEIRTASELAFLTQAEGEWLNYNYILANDIVLNDIEMTWDEHGNLTTDTSALKQWPGIRDLNGIFDGGGFTVYGVYMDSAESVAFFYNLNTTVRNLNLKNAYIRSTDGSAAGICLDNSSEDVEHCTFDGAVVGKSKVGGIVSHMYGYVKFCTNYGSIFGSSNYVGGIAGYLQFWGIEDSVNHGTVFSTGDYVGGVVGKCSDLYTPERCDNTGAVIGRDYVGGICGLGPNGGWASGNNEGNVAGRNYVGGLLGSSEYGEIRGSFEGNNSGNVTGEEYVGGIIGHLSYLTLKNCNNSGNVTGTLWVGGIAGHSESIWGRAQVTNCYYLRTDTINTDLSAFGNTPQDPADPLGHPRDFFCINDENKINSSGHAYSKDNPCDPTCEHCGQTREVTHTFSIDGHDEASHWTACKCGEIQPGSQAAHSGGIASCLEKACCDVCGEVYGDFAPHEYDDRYKIEPGKHYQICTVPACAQPSEKVACSDQNNDHKCDACPQVISSCSDQNGDSFCDLCQATIPSKDKTPGSPSENAGASGCSGTITPSFTSVLLLIGVECYLLCKKKRK